MRLGDEAMVEYRKAQLASEPYRIKYQNERPTNGERSEEQDREMRREGCVDRLAGSVRSCARLVHKSLELRQISTGQFEGMAASTEKGVTMRKLEDWAKGPDEREYLAERLLQGEAEGDLYSN